MSVNMGRPGGQGEHEISMINSSLSSSKAVLGEKVEKVSNPFIEFFTKSIPHFFASLTSTSSRIDKLEKKLEVLCGGLKSADTTTGTFAKSDKVPIYGTARKEKEYQIQNEGLNEYLDANRTDVKKEINKVVLELDELKKEYTNRKTPELRANIHQMLHTVVDFVDKHKADEVDPALSRHEHKLLNKFI